MSNPKEEIFFYLPQNPDIPEIEILSLAPKEKIFKITQCITVLQDDSSTKSYPFSFKDFKRLCNPQKWMKGTTVSTLMYWFNMICKKNGDNCCVRSGWSAKLVNSYYNTYTS